MQVAAEVEIELLSSGWLAGWLTGREIACAACEPDRAGVLKIDTADRGTFIKVGATNCWFPWSLRNGLASCVRKKTPLIDHYSFGASDARARLFDCSFVCLLGFIDDGKYKGC